MRVCRSQPDRLTDYSRQTLQGVASAPGWDKPLRQPTDFRPDFAGSRWAWISVGQTGVCPTPWLDGSCCRPVGRRSRMSELGLRAQLVVHPPGTPMAWLFTALFRKYPNLAGLRSNRRSEQRDTAASMTESSRSSSASRAQSEANHAPFSAARRAPAGEMRMFAGESDPSTLVIDTTSRAQKSPDGPSFRSAGPRRGESGKHRSTLNPCR